MTVTETITVNAEGNRIRRGIFRDFPLTFVDEKGRRRSVDFDVVSVKRDGNDEPWKTETVSGGIRIYAGSEDVMLPPGRHQYAFTYTTNRQIRYFADHDELYWNVTGNGWIFPIMAATATVNLPDGVTATDTNVFTGALGAKDKNARISGGNARPVFSTTMPLDANEGLTIAVKLPKGAIDPPSESDQNIWWLKDNRDYFIGFGGLLLVFLYYTRSWLKVGRDPSRGVLVPRWDPPEGISPALVNYIDNKGISGGGWTALSATALDLAVRGYVVLEDLRQSIIVRRTQKPVGKEKLEAGETSLLSAVANKGSLTIDKANGERVKSVGQSFRSAIEREHRGKYYNSNTGYTTGGIALSAAALVALFVFGTLEPDAIVLMIIPIVVSRLRRHLRGRLCTVVPPWPVLGRQDRRCDRDRRHRFCRLQHRFIAGSGASLHALGIPRDADALCRRRHRAAQPALCLHHGGADAAWFEDHGWHRRPSSSI